VQICVGADPAGTIPCKQNRGIAYHGAVPSECASSKSFRVLALFLERLDQPLPCSEMPDLEQEPPEEEEETNSALGAVAPGNTPNVEQLTEGFASANLAGQTAAEPQRRSLRDKKRPRYR
jgi:hypothetical protein